MEWFYIRIHITPILTYLRSSLQTSLQIHLKQKGNRKMTSLKSGVKLGNEEVNKKTKFILDENIQRVVMG